MELTKSMLIIIFSMLFTVLKAQFVEQFESSNDINQPPAGWITMTGDGNVDISFIQKKDYARITVDATQDIRNIWWALVKKEVTAAIDIKMLSQNNYELRIEAKIRASDAPKRINLHTHTDQTTDHHSHLMEYDIPNADQWQVVSMTTQNFNVDSDGQVFAQLSLMDWGIGIFELDIDYFKVEVVEKTDLMADLGNPVPYWPPLADPKSFEEVLKVSNDAMISEKYPEINFNEWHDATTSDSTQPQVLTANNEHIILLKWDFEGYKNKKIQGAGQLALFTHQVFKKSKDDHEFGKIRITEVLAGHQNWEEESVTMKNFLGEFSIEEVINQQMIVDTKVTTDRFAPTLVTISEPVMQRILNGTTKGIAITTLGSIDASFYSHEAYIGKYAAELRFNIE